MIIRPVKQKTVVYQVIQQLKEQILSGILKSGDRLPSEFKLAEIFGVGRSTVREVVKILQYMGIVEVHNPKGIFLCDSSNISSASLEWAMLLGEKDVSEVIELRMVMETQGLWYLLEYYRHDRELRNTTIAALEAEIVKMDKAIDAGSTEERLDADYRFHGVIIAVCKNRIFENLYKTMREFTRMEIKFAQDELTSANEIPKNHSELLLAVKEGDFHNAMTVFKNHIHNFDFLLAKQHPGQEKAVENSL